MRILEVHVEVTDLEHSLSLYTKLIPHSRVSRWEDGSAIALILEDGSAFGLWQKGKIGIHRGRAGAHVHFAFQIDPAEYDDYKSRIESVGLTPLEYLWENGHRSVYFFDDDGNQGEFMTVDWLGNV